MSPQPLDELYFHWLCDQVGSEAQHRTLLLEQIFLKEFVWHIPNDDNRAVDGTDLRLEFLNDVGISNPPNDWMWLQCSMLEMLVALSRKLAFEADGEPRDWFWVLIKNIRLYHYTNEGTVPIETINEVLDRIVWRNYGPTGHGGLFPLQYPTQDQREVEIWYQMSAYLLERIAA